MSQKYLTNIDLNKNQLLNAIIQTLAVEPSNAKEGQIIYDSTVKKLKIYNGEVWVEVGSEISSDELINLINQSSLKIDKDKIQGLTDMLDNVSMSGIDIVEAINSVDNTSKIDLGKLAEGLVKTADLNNLQTTEQAESDKSELTQAIESAKQSVQASQSALEERVEQVEARAQENIPQTKVEGLEEALQSVDTKDAEILKESKKYTDTSITNLVGLASEDANTLKELEDLIKANKDEILSIANTYKKFTQEIGDNVSLSHTINHNLHTQDVVVELYDTTTGEKLMADISIVDSDNVKVETSQPISESEKIRVVVLGHNGSL